MSRIQKVFLASALVAIGFGVATFLGQPVLPTRLLELRPAPAIGQGVVQVSLEKSSAAAAPGRVRLLPEPPEMLAGVAVAAHSDTGLQSPQFSASRSPVSSVAEPGEPRKLETAPISSAPIVGASPARARLRDESPRAIRSDSPSPAIRRLPEANPTETDPNRLSGTSQVSMPWSAPQLLRTEYNTSQSASPATIHTSYVAPANSTADNISGPSAWPSPDDPAESRVHVVADGDSLERIASRYLSDPKRSREIYELNRSVLSSPDLLPIGVELKIPDRVEFATLDRHPAQRIQATIAEFGAMPSNSVPDQTMLASPKIIPRAQLTAPENVQ